MTEKGFYKLPSLPYGYGDLAPQISEEQLKIHHQKHHQAYVDGANSIYEKLDLARKEDQDIDVKAILKELSWNVGGHLLHSLFWENMAPNGKAAANLPAGEIAEAIKNEFGGFERFKKEFTKAAASVEGSGWAALTYCNSSHRPLIMQIEKHNCNVIPMFHLLLVCDVFEHAYYLDYKNARAKFIDAFWSLVNWKAVDERFKAMPR